MKSNSESFLLIIIALAIGFIKANEIKIAEVIENLNTLKILKEIQTLDTNTHCTDDIKEYVKNLLSNKLWALKSKWYHILGTYSNNPIYAILSIIFSVRFKRPNTQRPTSTEQMVFGPFWWMHCSETSGRKFCWKILPYER